MIPGLKRSFEGHVLTLTFDRPQKKNALTGAMYEALTEALRHADMDDQVRAIVLHGNGGTFTAGNDINDFIATSGDFTDFPALHFIKQLAICDTPIVAAVDGAAIGIGTTLLLHCDLVYASPAALFVMPFIDLALVPEAAASLLVPMRFGLAKASELLLLADPINADEAHRIGLVNAVVPSVDVLKIATAQAHRLAAKPVHAMKTTRRLLRGDCKVIVERIYHEAELFRDALRSDEARDAFTQFLSRNKAG